MQYANMVIEASNEDLVRSPDNRRAGTFQVRVLNSPAGDMRPEEAVAVEYDDIALQSTLQNLELRNLDRLALVAFGRELAGWLLPPERAGATTSVRNLFLKSLLQLGQDTGLRLRLRLPPQLAALPWEYMYVDPPGGGDGIDGFLALNRRISIVRYEPLNAPALPPATPGKVEVVVALSSPEEFPPLDLAKEKADLQLALDKQSGLIKVVYLDHAKSSDVQSAIARAGAGVFHFAGHGAFTEQMGSTPGTYTGTGSLILDDTALTAEQISVILGNSIRLAVLGACETGRRDGINIWSGTALGLVKAQVPAVVANQFTILDNCAIAFDEQFYEAALVGGLSLEEAVSAGRIAAYTVEPNGREWGVPVLYLRSDDSHLFGGVIDDKTRQDAIDSATTVIDSAPAWNALLKSSVESARNFQGTPDRPGTFIPDVYVHRTDAEDTLNSFLSSEASALIVVSDTGMGKTNTLCSWVTALQEEGYVAFLYSCIVFTSSDVGFEVARDLSPGAPDALSAALEGVSKLAAAKGKQCVLVFDAISEFRSTDSTGPETLLKQIIAFVEHLPDNLRVVLSCRTSTWSRLSFDFSQSFSSSKYYSHAKDQEYLLLEPFTPQLLEEAYQLYAQVFQLKTPLDHLPALLRDRLQNPLMLRMLAEVYRDEPIAYGYLALSVFERFYEERVDVNRPQGLLDQQFLDNLAAKMLNQQRNAFRVTELAQDKDLGQIILSTAPDSIYNRLLDNGILTVVTDPRLPGALGNMVRFAYDQLGGYVLALYLLRQPGIDVGQKIQELISHVQQFPLAWYTSQALLILNDDTGLYSTLAKIDSIELRELVVESLLDLYTDEAEKAKGVIQQLVQSAAPDVQRIGLKAAYSVNPPASEVFLWAAIQDKPGLPQLTRNILYLIWQTNPTFTYDLLRQLTGSINLGVTTVLGAVFDANARRTIQRTVQFVFDLLITIYINHCEKQYVIDQTSDIFFDLTKNRLHLDVLNPGLLGPDIEQFFVQSVTPIFTKPFLDALLYVDRDHARHFFDVPVGERASLKQIAPYLDPHSDLANVKDVLVTLLKADLMIFNLVAALVLSVHAYADFATMQPLIQNLFEEQGTQGQGRLWILLSFTLLLPDTPKEWVGVVEEFTRRLIEEQPAIFYGEEASINRELDIALLPLGLAYGKGGNSMPYIEALLSGGLQQNNMRLVIRCVKALATVGFYYPGAALHTLGVTMPAIATAPDEFKSALINSLAIMRVLHFDDVDDFLRHIGADETLQRNVSEATDAALVDRNILLLGWFNNGVHYSVYYPIMRQRLGITALNMLADSATPDEFINRYTLEGIHLTRDTDFVLKAWTLPT